MTSGHLAPDPVTRQTTVSSGASRPARAALIAPATDAAEEGSTRYPLRASRRTASMISSSVTSVASPPESYMARSAAGPPVSSRMERRWNSDQDGRSRPRVPAGTTVRRDCIRRLDTVHDRIRSDRLSRRISLNPFHGPKSASPAAIGQNIRSGTWPPSCTKISNAMVL